MYVCVCGFAYVFCVQMFFLCKCVCCGGVCVYVVCERFLRCVNLMCGILFCVYVCLFTLCESRLRMCVFCVCVSGL